MTQPSDDDLIIQGDEAWTREAWERVPHGTRTGYIAHGCRCDDCRNWRHTYYGKEQSSDPR